MARLFIGNLSFNATDAQELAQFLADEGITAEKPNIIVDRMTNQSKGFAFVEVADGDAQKAVDNLNGVLFHGRPLRVDRALAKPSQPSAGRSGGRAWGPPTPATNERDNRGGYGAGRGDKAKGQRNRRERNDDW